MFRFLSIQFQINLWQFSAIMFRLLFLNNLKLVPKICAQMLYKVIVWALALENVYPWSLIGQNSVKAGRFCLK